MKRRSLLLAIAFGMFLALLWVGPALAVTFPDVPTDHPYRAAIEGLAARHVVGGYGNGNFGPGDPVKRMQFAKMIVLALDFTVSPEDMCTFSDVPSGTPQDPLYPDHYVAVAAKNHLVMGYTEDNTFRPDNKISRYQVVTMVVRAGGSELGTPPPGWQGVLDYSDATHGENLKIAEFNGLLAGLQGLDEGWSGGGDATRGECAQLLWNLVVFKEAHNKWADLGPALSPMPRAGEGMVNLPDGRTLLFGGAMSGEGGSVYWNNDVYLYDPLTNLWSKAAAVDRPSNRAWDTMIYCPSIGKVILFGGAGGKGVLNDTWSYDPTSGVWTDLKPLGPLPTARMAYAMALVPGSGRLILFGGYDMDTSVRFGDTWAYDLAANTWTELHPSGTGPSARRSMRMAYDPATAKVILFGGLPGSMAANDTWAYDPAANSWTQLAPSGSVPSARFDYALARDAVTGRFILFGGYVSGGTIVNDTYAYDPVQNSWSALNSIGPPPARYQSAMVYDAAKGRMMIFGGIAADNTTRLGDNWAYTP
jgi:N-acetylneuraminic acid mutarotase